MKRSTFAILPLPLLAVFTAVSCSSPDNATSSGTTTNSGATTGGDAGSSDSATGTDTDARDPVDPVDPSTHWMQTQITAGEDEGSHVAIDGAGNVLAAFQSRGGTISQPVETLNF